MKTVVRRISFGLLLSANLCTASFAQSPPASTARSFLSEAGVLNRVNKLCGRPLSSEVSRTLGDFLLAASVNPRMDGAAASDEQLLTGIRQPSAERLESVRREIEIYNQVVGLVTTRHEVEGAASVCSTEFQARANVFVKNARADGTAAQAKRIADLMVRNRCAALGCRAA